MSDLPAAAREDVSFSSGSDTCAAWLYRPSLPGPHPVVVMAHGLGGVKAMRLGAFAERFQAAGYACVVFDYRHFGDSSGEPRALIDIRRQREDWRSAVTFARTLPDIDPDRVVVWGTSFGGGHAIVTAADDPQVAAAIAQCPFTDGFASARAMEPLVSVKLAAAALRDRAAAALGREPVRVSNAAAPGQLGLMTAPDALRGYNALLEAAETGADPSMIPARVALDIPRSFPGRRAADVRCPILFCVCQTDTVAPAPATLKHAARAPRGEICRYPDGHFDVYLGDAFERVVADQLAFLERHLTDQ